MQCCWAATESGLFTQLKNRHRREVPWEGQMNRSEIRSQARGRSECTCWSTRGQSTKLENRDQASTEQWLTILRITKHVRGALATREWWFGLLPLSPSYCEHDIRLSPNNFRCSLVTCFGQWGRSRCWYKQKPESTCVVGLALLWFCLLPNRETYPG